MSTKSIPWARAVLFMDDDNQVSIPVRYAKEAGSPTQRLMQVIREWPKSAVGKPVKGMLIRQRDSEELAVWSAS